MIKKLIAISFALLAFAGLSFVTSHLSATTPSSPTSDAYAKAPELYEEIGSINQNYPSYDVFALAIKGFNNLKATQKIKKSILTVIDFSKSSNEKRLWVIDLKTRKVLFNDYVAHGRNSGDEFAKTFSDIPSSYMSSIGFYVTDITYQGKHGLSLRLDGVDGNFNKNARERAIVMHGADYVSPDFINKYGRLGRSFGCPSVSMEIYKDVIETICDGSLLFIYYPDKKYLQHSSILNPPGSAT
ncbi:MAG TPA: murein L,D-transpeptidase catalytic domain family protein [Bacteroidales bacterium]|nr:murein L,D-transpeptidase catalytic domain family protein [Bacteroidales bacterium]